MIDEDATESDEPTARARDGRWSPRRKRDAVLRILRGESPEHLAAELGVAVELLHAWQERALHGIDSALRQRMLDPLQLELSAVHKSLTELMMENELLRARCHQAGPLAWTPSSR